MKESDIASAIKGAVVDGRLPCARAFELAKELDVPVSRIGKACDEMGVKITNCQLGCFGRKGEG